MLASALERPPATAAIGLWGLTSPRAAEGRQPVDNSRSNERTWPPPPHLDRSGLTAGSKPDYHKTLLDAAASNTGCNPPDSGQASTNRGTCLKQEGYSPPPQQTISFRNCKAPPPVCHIPLWQRQSSSASITTYLYAGAGRSTRASGQACRDEQRTMSARQVTIKVRTSDRQSSSSTTLYLWAGSRSRHIAKDEVKATATDMQDARLQVTIKSRTQVKAIAPYSKMPGFPVSNHKSKLSRHTARCPACGRRGPGMQFFPKTDAAAAAAHFCSRLHVARGVSTIEEHRECRDGKRSGAYISMAGGLMGNDAHGCDRRKCTEEGPQWPQGR